MDIPFREASEELLSPKCGLVVEGSRSDESCSYGSSRRSLPGSSYSISPSRELSDVTLNAWTGENTNRNEFSVFSPKRSLASSSTLINPSASTLPKCSSNGSRSVVVCANASLVVYICVCVCVKEHVDILICESKLMKRLRMKFKRLMDFSRTGVWIILFLEKFRKLSQTLKKRHTCV